MTADATARAGRVPAMRDPEIVVRPRSGGHAERSGEAFTATHPAVDGSVDPEVEIAEGEVTPDERQRFEDELVAIIADVIVRQRTIAA